VTFIPQKINIACFKHNRVETNCSKVGVIGNAFDELGQIEEAASVQLREIENNPRQNDTNWCSCSKCISLPLPSECLCCHEFSLFDGQLEPSECITDNTNFRTVCLNPVVLETSYINFLRYKRHIGRAPDVLTNRQSRLMAYRQFVCWVSMSILF
jgi:hypothetical protein